MGEIYEELAPWINASVTLSLDQRAKVEEWVAQVSELKPPERVSHIRELVLYIQTCHA